MSALPNSLLDVPSQLLPSEMSVPQFLTLVQKQRTVVKDAQKTSRRNQADRDRFLAGLISADNELIDLKAKLEATTASLATLRTFTRDSLKTELQARSSRFEAAAMLAEEKAKRAEDSAKLAKERADLMRVERNTFLLDKVQLTAELKEAKGKMQGLEGELNLARGRLVTEAKAKADIKGKEAEAVVAATEKGTKAQVGRLTGEINVLMAENERLGKKVKSYKEDYGVMELSDEDDF